MKQPAVLDEKVNRYENLLSRALLAFEVFTTGYDPFEESR